MILDTMYYSSTPSTGTVCSYFHASMYPILYLVQVPGTDDIMPMNTDRIEDPLKMEDRRKRRLYREHGAPSLKKQRHEQQTISNVHCSSSLFTVCSADFHL